MGNLNILIYRREGETHAVVRYNYQTIEGAEFRWPIAQKSVWSPTDLNRVGQPGAFTLIASAESVEEGVAALRGRFGALPVQCNLSESKFDRPLRIENVVADSGAADAGGPEMTWDEIEACWPMDRDASMDVRR